MAANRPRLAVGVRLQRDSVRSRDVLLYPEGAVALNETAAAVLKLCDGERTLDQVVASLSADFRGAEVRDDVERLLAAMRERGLVVDADA
jgi:coenzyme PQQ biosynthesis protein PqqD